MYVFHVPALQASTGVTAYLASYIIAPHFATVKSWRRCDTNQHPTTSWGAGVVFASTCFNGTLLSTPHRPRRCYLVTEPGRRGGVIALGKKKCRFERNGGDCCAHVSRCCTESRNPNRATKIQTAIHQKAQALHSEHAIPSCLVVAASPLSKSAVHIVQHSAPAPRFPIVWSSVLVRSFSKEYTSQATISGLRGRV